MEKQHWTIAMKRPLLEAAMAFENKYGDEALLIADTQIDDCAGPEERNRFYAFWRYLMVWHCMGRDDKVSIEILPDDYEEDHCISWEEIALK